MIPDGYDVSLDIFRRLLLIRCWCPDRTLPQAKNYIADALGPTFAEGIVLNMENVWQESIPQTPLVGLLSMGSDPTNSIEALAKKHSLGNIYHNLLFFHMSYMFLFKEQLIKVLVQCVSKLWLVSMSLTPATNLN